jgi:hypothetical protein
MSKWGCIIHLNTLNTSYGQKKRLGVWVWIWLLTIKSWESPWITCVQEVGRKHATYRWKVLDKGYNFALNFTSIEGLHKKLWASKLVEVPISRIMGLPTWESQEKHHLGVAPMASHREYYERKGGGFPQVQTVLNLMSLCMPVALPCIHVVCPSMSVAHPCTKNVPTMH